jgi:putative ABC transport system permease protein
VLPQEFPRLHEIAIDTTTLVFALGATLLSSLLFGLLPALRTGRSDTVAGLKEGGPGSGTSRRRLTARNALVVVQVGLALMLVVGSGLMARSYAALHGVDPGFAHPEAVLTFRVNLAPDEVGPELGVAAFHEGLIRRIAELPGVVSVSGSNNLPMDGNDSNQGLEIEDFPVRPDDNLPFARVKWVAGDYFETLQIPLLLGRTLTWEDARRQAPVVVVNEAYARAHWGEAVRALGRRIRYGGQPWREIVGVVKDVHDDGFDVAPDPTVYWPLVVDGFWGVEPWVPRWFAYAVRTTRPDPTSLIPEIREVARGVDPGIPLFAVRTMDDVVRLSMARTTLTMSLLAIAALLALCLATVGVYGVITYSVSRRTREIGLRLALGADAGGVRSLVLRQGLSLVLIGVAAGLAGSLALTGIVSSLLFGVRPLDPATYVAASAGTVAVALVATYLPALRASRMNPTAALVLE